MTKIKGTSVSKTPVDIEKMREAHPNAYMPWTKVLDDKLKEDFANGSSIDDLVKSYGRKKGAIRSRLIKLGLITKKNSRAVPATEEAVEVEKEEDGFEIGWFTKLLLKIWPNLAMSTMAKKMGINDPIFDRAHEIFSKIGRVDLFPFQSGHRGFMMVLDGKTALYFYQDGDHFSYDGFEMGEYEKGDITIFDNIGK